MEVKDIKKLLDAIHASSISEFVLETGDYKLTVRRGSEAAETRPATPDSPSHLAGEATSTSAEAQKAPSGATPAAAPAASGQGGAEAATRAVEVTAPIVGTFYSAPSPEAPPYVKVGDRVQQGQVLCIIEAMKLMNEIEAEVAGTVVEILVRNEEPVEYGQVLFRIEPG